MAEQYEDRSRAVRRIDHPRTAIHRLELLNDDELDAYRRAHPQRSAEALDAHELLLAAMEARTAEVERAAVNALEHRTRERPILTVAVCLACGAHAVARGARRWDLDRAMRRTGSEERDLLRIALMLAEAWADLRDSPPTFDQLTVEQIRELLELVGHDVDHDCIRDRYGPPRVASGLVRRQLAHGTDRSR